MLISKIKKIGIPEIGIHPNIVASIIILLISRLIETRYAILTAYRKCLMKVKFMNKYYGLHLIRVIFVAASIVISISTIATIGGLSGLALIQGESFDGIQALIALIIGGIISLLCYSFGQLVDVNLKSYEVSYKLLEQIEEANRLNNKTVNLLNKQLRLMHTEFNLDQEIDVRKIEKQIEERRSNLG